MSAHESAVRLREPSPKQKRNLFLLRSVLAIGVFTTISFPQLYETSLKHVWEYLTHSRIYTLSTWETILTVVSYTVTEIFYTRLAINPAAPIPRIDQRPGDSHLYFNGTVRIHSFRTRISELYTYVLPLLFLDLILIKKFIGVSREEIIRSGGYDIPSGFGVDSLTGLAIRESWKIPTLHNFTWSSPLQLTRALPKEPPTSRQIMLGVVSALALYDVLFYIPHVLMHKVRWLWRAHITHHKHSEIHAQITNQLSITERLILLTSANLSLHLTSAHPLTRTIFVPVFLWMLVENHCGLDLPYGYDKLLPKGWVAGPLEHAEHHRHGKSNFQPYLTWIDRLTGTYSNGLQSTTTT